MKTSFKRAPLADLPGGVTLSIVMLIMMIFALFTLPVSGEEPKAYTDEDLEKYTTHSTYDEETIRQSEANLKRWEKEKEIKEKLESDKREADDKRATEQKRTSIRESVVTQKTIEEPDNKSAKTVKKRKT